MTNLRVLIGGILLLMVPTVLRAQLTTCNNFVEADVSADGQGLVTIFEGPCRSHQIGLTHGGTSFLTVLVNGSSFYTNNYEPLNSNPEPKSPTGLLSGGKTVKIGDTIRTDWEPQGVNTFDIIQDVFPVEFPLAGSGQVVVRFSIVNHQTASLNVQAQYLLDVDLTDDNLSSSAIGGGDNAPVTTRFGYMDVNWTSFPNPSNGDGIPPYFIPTFQPISDGLFPELTAEGYCNDSLAPEPMGLVQPSLFAFVYWPEIVQGWTWGFPTSPVSPQINDDALLFQWPGGRADQGDTVVIGSFSYGSAACAPVSIGNNLDALLIHPDHIVWSGAPSDTYVPNRFPVDAVVWNHGTTEATSVLGSQTITNAEGMQDGPVRIVNPVPVTNNGYTQQHSTGDSIASLTAGSLSWEDTVLASILTNCETDSSYDITFSLTASGIGNTTFLTGPCVCPVVVDCEEKSNIVPQTTVLNRSGSYDGSECNTRCTEVVAFDTGATRIPVLSVQSDTLVNLTLSIAPNHAGADSTFYTVCVIDSLLNGHAAITITDSLGNSSIEDYEYCTIADTHAPELVQIICIDTIGGPCTYLIADTQAWDRGLDTIYFTNLNKVKITPPDTVHGRGVAGFSVLGVGSFCVTAIDLAGNRFDTCFGGAASVSTTSPSTIALSITPNPASGDATIAIQGAPSADVEIFDVLGREVASFRVDGTYDWQTGAMPSGMYIIRAAVNVVASNSQTISKRIVKE